MKKIRYYGKLLVRDEWIDIDPEKATFEMADDAEPFEYFVNNIGIKYFLITYIELKE